MLKQTRSFLTLALLICATVSLIPARPVQAQNRHAYLEEFTASWCGFCVRGSYAIETLKQKYPGQIAIMSIHNTDPMANAQGDSLVSCNGGLSSQRVPGFPDSWADRSVISPATTWNVDPAQWGTGVEELFGLNPSQYPDAIVDAINAQPATVKCVIDNVSYDLKTNMVTARVTATFNSALSGDFRLNVMVTEDSVTGSDPSQWSQHNYYSSSDANVGANLPNNPYYDSTNPIPNWQYMDVFREAVGGVWGQKGIIPATTTSGASYSKTFTFPLSSLVVNPAHVHLIGLVHQFSATDATANQVFDAMEVPLSTYPEITLNAGIQGGTNYLSVPAGVATKETLTINNTTPSDITVSLTPSAVTGLTVPTGWTVSISTNTVTVPKMGQATALLTITAPSTAGFVWDTIHIAPSADGYIGVQTSLIVSALSQSSRFAVFGNPVTGAESATLKSWPDSLKTSFAALPISDSILSHYAPENFELAVFSDVPFLDWDPTVTTVPIALPPLMVHIDSLMSQGKKILITSDLGLFFALDPNSTLLTNDVQNFFQNTLGITYTASKNRFNTNTGAGISYKIGGFSDPIGNGLSLTATGGIAGGYYITTSYFSINSGSPSIPLFYSDGTKSFITSVKYEDPSIHSRVVYLGFDLQTITNQTSAGTIFTNAINWLMAPASSAVRAPQPVAAAGISASPNPFHGMTQVQYVASQDEHGVSLAAYDLLGREVAKLTTQSTGGNVYTALFDGSKLTNGTYVIVAHSSTGTHEVRVVNQQ